jgi:ferric-dicitrate binding protein FerR (iron transport regulator)
MALVDVEGVFYATVLVGERAKPRPATKWASIPACSGIHKNGWVEYKIALSRLSGDLAAGHNLLSSSPPVITRSRPRRRSQLDLALALALALDITALVYYFRILLLRN